MNLFGKIVLGTVMMVGLALSPVSLSTANAQGGNYGLEDAGRQAGLKDLEISRKKDPRELIGSVIGAALSFLGIVFMLLILYAGLKWMTALGSPEKAESAKKILESAAIGLIIVLGAYAIANFVFSGLGVASSGSSGGSAQVCSELKGEGGVAGICRSSCGIGETTAPSGVCGTTGDVCCLKAKTTP